MMGTRSGKIIGALFRLGLAILARTVRFRVEGFDTLSADKLIGYWHGDTIGAMLLITELYRAGIPVAAVVTANWRGDAIEEILTGYNTTSLRMEDGYAVRRTMTMLKDEAMRGGRLLAITLDGPSGPLHKPKRLVFRMAQQSEREMTYIRFEYGAVFRMNRRWDKYAVPLPFSRLVCHVESLGVITKPDLNGESGVLNSLKY